MADVVFAIPGDLGMPTGGYAYARRLLAGLPAAGWRVAPLALSSRFPDPTAACLDATAAAFAALPEGAVLLADGLAYGAVPVDVIRCAGERAIVALVHHPLGLEPGLSEPRAASLIASETAALSCADRVVATSPFTAGLLRDRFGVPAERLRVVLPGTDARPRVPPRHGGRTTLLAIGAVTPRKGYRILVEALTHLADLDWRLVIAGGLDRAPDHAADIRAAVADAGFAGRITLAGAVPDADLERLFAEADLVVSASLFEGYGMALAESLARGLPLVVARGGAAGETVPDMAGLTVPPGDVGALAEGLRLLMTDTARRCALADGAWRVGRTLPDWREATAAMAAVLGEVSRDVARGGPPRLRASS